jgi:hypothetical protein
MICLIGEPTKAARAAARAEGCIDGKSTSRREGGRVYPSPRLELQVHARFKLSFITLTSRRQVWPIVWFITGPVNATAYAQLAISRSPHGPALSSRKEV